MHNLKIDKVPENWALFDCKKYRNTENKAFYKIFSKKRRIFEGFGE